jgi:hypothetical protein
MGDLINVTFFYNDTDPSDGYVGGVPDAASICRLWGPTLPAPLPISISENGNGSYSVIIDSLNPNLYPITDGEPVLSDEPYYLLAFFHAHNLSACDITLEIEIIEIPTEVVSDFHYLNDFVLDMYEGDVFRLNLQYMDTWHDLPISNASISIDCSDPDVLQLMTNETQPETGIYILEFIFPNTGNVTITITMEKTFYSKSLVSFLVVVEQNPFDLPPPPPNPLLSLAIAAGLLVYVIRGHTSRVGWSRREMLQGLSSVIIAILIDVYIYLFVTQLPLPIPTTIIIGWTYCLWLAIGKGVDNNIQP